MKTYTTNKKKYSYCKKNFMTNHELIYYNIFKDLESDLNVVIQPQVHLISIVKRNIKHKTKYPKELNRIIDFAVFSRDYSELILLVEIGDNSHKRRDRVIRDKTVKSICKSAGIKLIYYYPQYSSDKDRVREFLRNEIISYYDTEKQFV